VLDRQWRLRNAIPTLSYPFFVPFNLSEFRQRKTLGASWRTLVGQHRNFGPSAIDAWFAPDPDPFAFFVELQPEIMAPS
jgi:hypothetical protein